MSSIISINLDSFIYAVRQAFEARTKKSGVFESHLKYTPFLENTWQKPEITDVESLKNPLNEILQHHWAAIPHYQRHESVTLENIAWFALSIATLFADIEYLCKESLGHTLPSKQDQSDEAQALWLLITKSIESVFNEYAMLFSIYSEWEYNPNTEKKEPVDWNVRPPCGLLYKTEFKALFDEIKRERFNKKQHHKSPSHRHQKNDNTRDNTPENTRDNTRENYRKHKPKKLFDDDRVALKSALEDCKKAIETVKGDSNIHELSLAPQNSFIRRHQHTLITDSGFDTDSRGEGNQRHVCIIKK